MTKAVSNLTTKALNYHFMRGTFLYILLKFTAFTVRTILRFRYKIIITGSGVFEKDTPKFILPNHQALIDPFILVSHLYRFTTVTPVISAKYYDLPVAKSFFRQLDAIRVSDLESGSRDTQVLKMISRSVYKGFRRGRNIVLYPAGQIAGQGFEKIFNKKSAHHIVSKLPDGVQVIGVRISGLWGSIFSKARSGKSPDLFIQLFKGIFFLVANLIFLLPKRTVTIEFENLTDIAKEKAAEGQKPFNSFLENFYNVNGEAKANYLKHYFFVTSS